MAEVKKQNLNTLLSSEQACISYLFEKRWPWGFICPFCGTEQKQMVPAHNVLCRYCRKQTSITARTPMHGTKKSLIAWMRIAWQFCIQKQGVSAKEIQRLMELSSYQTAWSWLQRIRHGAARAESALCCGNVLFDCISRPISKSAGQVAQDIGFALELNQRNYTTGRVRFTLLASCSPEAISKAANCLITSDATLLLKNPEWPGNNWLQKQYNHVKASKEQIEQGQLMFQKTRQWLKSIYRGAIDITYLQSYLAEFSFRHNTASWPDRMAVLDHLLTGLLSSTENSPTDRLIPVNEK